MLNLQTGGFPVFKTLLLSIWFEIWLLYQPIIILNKTTKKRKTKKYIIPVVLLKREKKRLKQKKIKDKKGLPTTTKRTMISYFFSQAQTR
jgi:hypothetical protein